MGHDPSRWTNADWRVLTTANAAGTNGLTWLPKHGVARDNNFLVTHPVTDPCESCLTTRIAGRGAYNVPIYKCLSYFLRHCHYFFLLSHFRVVRRQFCNIYELYSI
ncbi:unnamed protein product [Diatraea saccharalis]|uniref:Uncharacterized protein n=1 Tax=Diatraea saccharalis TaxID=40085 RepID=A0A9N9QUS7_9NEOP|nr:unnamed protein product [Diatraea saccharalis]